MAHDLERQARQRPTVERITWDADARVWRWRISAQTPNGPVTRSGTGTTYRAAWIELECQVSRLIVARAWGAKVAPELPLAGRKGRPPRPQLRGPGLA